MSVHLIVNKRLNISFLNRENSKTSCLYDIYPLRGDMDSSKCGMENTIRMELEERIGTKSVRPDDITWTSDLTLLNVFPRTLSTLFYIYDNSTFTVIPNNAIIIVPVNM